MLSKCANPDCMLAFDYRLGRLVRFHNHHPGDEVAGAWLCVRHFWLCDHCSRACVLEYQTGVGVVHRSRLGNPAEQEPPLLVCDCPLGNGSSCRLG
jgi:hypothetical protein